MSATQNSLRVIASCVAFCVGHAGVSVAHPHVFVDGGIDFAFGDGQRLEALDVTWRFDAFETLYMLAANDIDLKTHGALTKDDQQMLIRVLSRWPRDFNGSAHLSVDGASAALAPPRAFAVHLRDGRLELSFSRPLMEPIATGGRVVEVGFYEETYFYAFSVTDPPALRTGTALCATQLVPFEPTVERSDLQSVLLRLGREETPAIENVGALFADRVVMTCE